MKGEYKGGRNGIGWGREGEYTLFLYLYSHRDRAGQNINRRYSRKVEVEKHATDLFVDNDVAIRERVRAKHTCLDVIILVHLEVLWKLDLRSEGTSRGMRHMERSRKRTIRSRRGSECCSDKYNGNNRSPVEASLL